MLRLVLFLVGIAVVATGLSWLADRPGLIVFNWEGYEGEISVFHAIVALTFLIGLTIFLWSMIRAIWTSPATVGNYFYKRRQKRGLDALSSGIIAIGAGDRNNATRYAIQARKTLPNEPLTHLLRAQAAQLSGDKTTARRIFEAMLSQPDTEQLGLRGLFLEAQREGETEAAKQFAERALALNPKLAWSTDALFDLQCKSANWVGALQTLASAKKHGHIEKSIADRRRAVLLTAQAQTAEEQDPERALNLAIEAHNLAPNLVPAAAIAGRMLASRGNTPKAAKILQKTWIKAPHPDLATAYAFARLGDSPRDRLERVKQLANLTPNAIESPIAVARAAIDSRDFEAARAALEPLLDGRMTQRIATLMARIEGEEHGNKGRVREWLARAVNAPRDPAWTADGVVSENWAPISPVTGQLDAFQWRVPVEAMEKPDADLLADKLEELVALGGPGDAIDAIDAKPIATGPGNISAMTQDAPDAPPQKPSPATTSTVRDAVAAEIVTPEPVEPRNAPQAPHTHKSAAAVEITPANEPAAPRTRDPAEKISPETRNHATSGAAAKPAKAAVPAEVKPAAAEAKAAPEIKTAATESVPATTATKPKTKTAPATETSTSKSETATHAAKGNASEPKIFVSPRAPDDPGPDSSETTDLAAPMPRYGTSR